MKISRVQYALKETPDYKDRRVIHFETDSTVVLMQDGRTLEEFAASVDGNRKITFTGDVTGTVTMNGHDDATVDLTVGDDSHNHTGSTIRAGEKDRVVVTAEDGTIAVSKVSITELETLSGIKSNIQEQLDRKIVSSEINGNVVVDGKEMTIYAHPDIEVDNINLGDPNAAPELAYADTEFKGVKELSIDDQGHIDKLVMGNFKMPKFAQFFNTSKEPETSVEGDFWLETLSVQVQPGDSFMEDCDGDLAATKTVGSGTAHSFTMTDLDTNETEPAAPFEAFQALEILEDLG